MIWTSLICLIFFINSVVWNSDVINRAPVWCDICRCSTVFTFEAALTLRAATKLIIGGAVAIPAASLCINRRLYQIASVQSVTKTRAQKRRDIMIDLAIGLGIPLLEMILHVVVQSHRFLLLEEFGCLPFTWNTPLAYPLVWVWPIVIGLVSGSYCIRTIRELAIRRAQFKEFLSANKNLSSSRYFRLMGLAGIEVLCTIPLGCYSIYLNLTSSTLVPYHNWSFAHDDFGAIEQIPSVLWHQTQVSVSSIETTRFFPVLCAFIFFAFFGFADEARRNYRLAYVSVAKRVGLSTGSMSATGTWTANGTNPDMSYHGRSGTMPVFITHQTDKKRDSMVSFSSRISLPDFGGALVDGKKEPFSPTATSSGSMSKESLPRSPVDLESVPLPTLPRATLDTSAPPRYAPDVPHAV
ncbi:STE3-domain-containing protein [Butyriboletus roseoflavus]|nr:STE3-domain-containing protein [Butyriboletus roseoflavus]